MKSVLPSRVLFTIEHSFQTNAFTYGNICLNERLNRSISTLSKLNSYLLESRKAMISCEYSSAIKEESDRAGTVSLTHAESNNATTPALSCTDRQRATSASTESEKVGISGSRKATVSTRRQKESGCSSSEPPSFPGAHIQVHNKREWTAITEAQKKRLNLETIFY